jgi:hypothetical protein
MMNRLSVAITVCLAVFIHTNTAMAAWGDGPGCGWGKMLFPTEPKSVLMQHFGSTSNLPSQPFGISSGTSGCTNNGMIVKDERATVFANLNFENLSQEMAQGHGEHLAALAALLSVPPDRQAAFFSLVQANYLELMQAGDTTPHAMLSALYNAMAEHPLLAEASVGR